MTWAFLVVSESFRHPGHTLIPTGKGGGGMELLLVGAGLWLSAVTGFFPVRRAGLVLRDVLIRVSTRFSCKMHIDFDEANAALVKGFTLGRIIR